MISMSFEIIDFHTHPFISNEDNLCMYKESIDMNYETIGVDMEVTGISMFCGSVIRKKMQSFETLKNCNRDALELRNVYKDSYIPGFHVHPKFIREGIHFSIYHTIDQIRSISTDH